MKVKFHAKIQKSTQPKVDQIHQTKNSGYGYKPASVVLPRISANSFWDSSATVETQRDMPEENIRYIPGPPGPPGPPGQKGNLQSA